MSRLVFAFMWLVHFLPLAGMARVGNAVGNLLFWLIPERRKVTRINLHKCFPRKSAEEREQLARAHFRAFTRAFIEQGILWWSPPGRIKKLVQLEGLENLKSGNPKTIVFAPHFVGFEATLAPKLAGRANIACFLAYARRLPRGAGYALVVRPLPPSLPQESPTRWLNRALEALVRECPGQYLWGYNRYKTPRGAKGPPA